MLASEQAILLDPSIQECKALSGPGSMIFPLRGLFLSRFLRLRGLSTVLILKLVVELLLIPARGRGSLLKLFKGL